MRVLVIDDDPMSRDLLSVLLQAEGYAVECAESGDAAITQFLPPKDPPAVDERKPPARPDSRPLRRISPETLQNEGSRSHARGAQFSIQRHQYSSQARAMDRRHRPRQPFPLQLRIGLDRRLFPAADRINRK